MEIFNNDSVRKTIASLLGAIREENDDMFGISYAGGLLTALVELLMSLTGMDKDEVFMELYPLLPTDVTNIEDFIPHDYEEAYDRAYILYAARQNDVVKGNNL